MNFNCKSEDCQVWWNKLNLFELIQSAEHQLHLDISITSLWQHTWANSGVEAQVIFEVTWAVNRIFYRHVNGPPNNVWGYSKSIIQLKSNFLQNKPLFQTLLLDYLVGPKLGDRTSPVATIHWYYKVLTKSKFPSRNRSRISPKLRKILKFWDQSIPKKVFNIIPGVQIFLASS